MWCINLLSQDGYFFWLFSFMSYKLNSAQLFDVEQSMLGGTKRFFWEKRSFTWEMDQSQILGG